MIFFFFLSLVESLKRLFPTIRYDSSGIEIDRPDAVGAIAVGFPTGEFGGDCRCTFRSYLQRLLRVPYSDETIGIT